MLLGHHPDYYHITLLHVLRKFSAEQELMGEKFVRKQREKLEVFLHKAKEIMVQNGFHPNNIEIKLTTEQYSTIVEGIIDQCRKKTPDMVVVGRQSMSKAEEFVMGDKSIKLIRSLETTAIMVVKLTRN